MATQNQCCLTSCTRAQERVDLPLAVWPPSDSPPMTLWAHSPCFGASRSPSVLPDSADDHGRIPAQAKCVFCGLSLPTVGQHPYALDVGQSSPPSRFWAHAHCLKNRIAGFKPSMHGSASPLP